MRVADTRRAVPFERHALVFLLIKGRPSPPVSTGMTQARDGSVWVATGFSRQGGAARYFAGNFTNLTVADGLAGELTRSVYEDNDGRMWIGSEYDGVAAGVPEVENSDE